jgi:carbonic anhydrase
MSSEDFMSSHQFATAINCMDGRVQVPVIAYIKTKYKVDYVDMITEAGPVKLFSEENGSVLMDSIKRRVEVSVFKHNSRLIAIVGHYDCAGNPTGREVQIEQIGRAIQTVEAWGLPVRVLGLWVDKNWEVNELP